MKIIKWTSRYGGKFSCTLQNNLTFDLEQKGKGRDYCRLECFVNDRPFFYFAFKKGMSMTECSQVVDDLHNFLCEEGNGIKDWSLFAFSAENANEEKED